MQKNSKIFEIDGKKMQFDSIIFEKMFKNSKRKEESILEYEMRLGELLNVSSHAVHNWRFGTNGPFDIELMKQLAAILKMENFKLLLKEAREKQEMELKERQKDSVKRIYDAVIEYLDFFKSTNGFNDYWCKLKKQGFDSSVIEDRLYDIAEQELHKVELVIEKEYIELFRLPFYNFLLNYVYDVLPETYNGKLSYAYRFEAQARNSDGTVSARTTQEDYFLAMKGIHDIVEQYM